MKALSINAFGSRESGMQNAGLTVPGSNMYANQGANPIFTMDDKKPVDAERLVERGCAESHSWTEVVTTPGHEESMDYSLEFSFNLCLTVIKRKTTTAVSFTMLSCCTV